MDPVFNTQASRIAEKVARPRAFPSRILLLNVQKILSTKAVEHFRAVKVRLRRGCKHPLNAMNLLVRISAGEA